MPVKNYTTLDGMILGERDADGTRRNYMHDALGSVVGTIVDAAVENTYAYKPYGGILAKTGTGADPAFGWVGTQGYKAQSRDYSDVYVRARHLSRQVSRWTSDDPMNTSQVGASNEILLAVKVSERTGLKRLVSGTTRVPGYAYGDSSPASQTDPSGLLGGAQLKEPPNRKKAPAWVGPACEITLDVRGIPVNGCTDCDFDGKMYTYINRSVGCTLHCTEDHEKVHRVDYAACCARVPGCMIRQQSSGLSQADAETRCRNKFLAGTAPIVPWSECRAHCVSLQCRQRVLARALLEGNSACAAEAMTMIRKNLENLAARNCGFVDPTSCSLTAAKPKDRCRLLDIP
jgi:hypothetical protein